MGEFKLGSHLAQGDVESVEVETVERRSGRGRGGGQRHYRCKEGRGEIRLCIKQTKLSTLQVSFHQCNFCQQNNRKRKGKVYELLVKHQDIRDGATETQTVVAGEKERGLRKMSVLKKSQRGEIVMEAGLSKTVVATPIMASAI